MRISFSLSLLQQHLCDTLNIWFGQGLLLDCCWVELQGVFRWPERGGFCCLMLSQSHRRHKTGKSSVKTLLQLALCPLNGRGQFLTWSHFDLKYLSVAGKMSWFSLLHSVFCNTGFYALNQSRNTSEFHSNVDSPFLIHLKAKPHATAPLQTSSAVWTGSPSFTSNIWRTWRINLNWKAS